MAICGASAALAISAVLPKRDEPREGHALHRHGGHDALHRRDGDLSDHRPGSSASTTPQTGFLIGATIHDVAQVVGAGYSVSDVAGDLATLVKLERVAMLPIVLLAITLVLRQGRGQGRRPAGLPDRLRRLRADQQHRPPPPVVQTAAATLSQWLLTIAIAGLGIRTSIKSMLDLGPRHLILVVAETLFLLGAALLAVRFVL